MSAVLTDNLPLLAGAPNGIKKLRELILQLAVLGKLVESSDQLWTEMLLGDLGAWGSGGCLLYTSPSPRDLSTSRMPSSA